MNSLSVLLPVYNAAPYLKETLESLIGQTRQADQIVIVNDGSTDHSLELLEKYQRTESRIQLISQENGGVSSARNLGLSACKGDYVALMDADDICQPSRFDTQLNVMQEQRLDLCGTWIKTFGSKEREIKYPTSNAELRLNYLFLGRTIANPTAMIKRTLIGTLRYDERLVFAEDFGFFLSLMLSNPALRMANIPQPLLHYRTHAAQASQRHAEKNEASLKLLLAEKFNEAGFDASEPQIDAHYQIWKRNTPVSLDQLQAYLPLMHTLTSWVEIAPETHPLSIRCWSKLAKQQAHLGKAGLALIREFSGEPQFLLQRLFRRFTQTP
ncbi:glycosyltransferase [Pseudomonas chengduensis]|nr:MULTISPECIES: glycosyltransferase family 2 protein [Pseudomonas]MDH1536391.1 glycosyltransferase [Pseudomonas chengduensis]TRO44426.1 glycosyltransferase family 2 protein [Pseudomonas sp. ALS1279]